MVNKKEGGWEEVGSSRGSREGEGQMRQINYKMLLDWLSLKWTPAQIGGILPGPQEVCRVGQQPGSVEGIPFLAVLQMLA